MSDELFNALLKTVQECQSVLTDYLKPDSKLTSEDSVNELLGILDNQDLAALMIESGY